MAVNGTGSTRVVGQVQAETSGSSHVWKDFIHTDIYLSLALLTVKRLKVQASL